jgi:hypothetical protein
MNSNDKKVTFAGFGILLIMIISALIFGSNATEGEQGKTSLAGDVFKDFQVNRTTESFSGELDQGASHTFSIDLSGKLLKNITATLTWTDESDLPGRPRIRRYENNPDTFSLEISDENGTHVESASGSNPQGREGDIRAKLAVNNSALAELFETEYDGETWTVDVTMVTAGGWSPQIGFIGFTDPGNSFSLVVEYEFYDIKLIRGE